MSTNARERAVALAQKICACNCAPGTVLSGCAAMTSYIEDALEAEHAEANARAERLQAQLDEAREIIRASFENAKEGLSDLPNCLVGLPDAMAYTCLSDIASDASDYLKKRPALKEKA